MDPKPVAAHRGTQRNRRRADADTPTVMIRTRTPPTIVAADRLTPTAAAPTAAASIAAAEPNASAALAATLPASPMASPACPSSDHFEASGTRAPACGPAALAMGPDSACFHLRARASCRSM